MTVDGETGKICHLNFKNRKNSKNILKIKELNFQSISTKINNKTASLF